MDFLNDNPTFLCSAFAAFLFACLLISYGGRKRRRMLHSLVHPDTAARLADNLALGRRRFRQLLLLAALGLIALAAARPWWGYGLVPTPSKSRDVLVAVDCSRSMLARDLPPSRLQHAKWWIRQLATQVPSDRIGLIAFAGDAFLECPLTRDRNTLFQFLDDLDSHTIPLGGTNVERALAVAHGAFEAAEGPYRTVVLITDGGQEQGDADNELPWFEEQDIPLCTVGLGDPVRAAPIRGADGKYVRDEDGDLVKSRLNESLLRRLATRSGGVYVRSTPIEPGVSPVAKRVSQLVPEEREGAQTRRPHERFQLPLAVAVLLLALRMVLGERSSRDISHSGTARTTALLAAAPLLISTIATGRADAVPRAEMAAPAKELMSSRQRDNETALSNAARARLFYNRGVRQHREEDLNEAEKLYEQSVDLAAGDSIVRARAMQNLDVLKQQKAETALRKNPERSLKLLDEADGYNREALRMASKPEDIGRNRQRLLGLRQRAEQRRKEMERKQQQNQNQRGKDNQQNSDTPENENHQKSANQQQEARQNDQASSSAQDDQNADQQGGEESESPDLPEFGESQDEENEEERGNQAEESLNEQIDEDVARALLLQMQEGEKDLREAIKEYRTRRRKPVERDW